MNSEFIDKSGQPRPENDLNKALHEVERQIISVTSFKCEPSLFVWLPTIRDALKELLTLRKAIRDQKKG